MREDLWTHWTVADGIASAGVLTATMVAGTTRIRLDGLVLFVLLFVTPIGVFPAMFGSQLAIAARSVATLAVHANDPVQRNQIRESLSTLCILQPIMYLGVTFSAMAISMNKDAFPIGLFPASGTILTIVFAWYAYQYYKEGENDTAGAQTPLLGSLAPIHFPQSSRRSMLFLGGLYAFNVLLFGLASSPRLAALPWVWGLQITNTLLCLVFSIAYGVAHRRVLPHLDTWKPARLAITLFLAMMVGFKGGLLGLPGPMLHRPLLGRIPSPYPTALATASLSTVTAVAFASLYGTSSRAVWYACLSAAGTLLGALLAPRSLATPTASLSASLALAMLVCTLLFLMQ